MPFRYAGKLLTGINDLRNTARCEEAIVCCSGTSLSRYDDSVAPPEWPRIAVNEAIRKLRAAEWWVLADDPIFHEYGDLIPPETKLLVMQQATLIAHRWAKGRRYWTVESMSKIENYDNGYQFFSRGTVLIGAIEMLRWIGHRRFFVFGCDCYRTKGEYYYDGRTPIPLSEKHFVDNQRVRGVDEKLYVTPKLRNMIDRLDAVKASPLWQGIEVWCVDSPLSQQRAMPKMSIEVFRDLAAEWRPKKVEAAGESPVEGAGVDQTPARTTYAASAPVFPRRRRPRPTPSPTSSTAPPERPPEEEP